jgi:hypothetical protein
MLSMNWNGYRKLAWIALAVLAVAVVVVAVTGQWWAAGSLTAFLIISYGFVAWEHTLPELFDLIFVIVALVNAIGWAWNLYNSPGPVDEIAHFCTIFALTLSFGYLFYNELMESFADHPILFVVTIASLGIAIGALWEVFEWLADFLTPIQIVTGLNDTITDIMLDSVGAVLAALLNLRGLHERVRGELSDRKLVSEPAHAHGAGIESQPAAEFQQP